MKFTFVLFLSFFLLTIYPSLLYAQEPVPTPSPNPVQIQWMNEFSVDNQPSAVIVVLKNFLTGIDSFLGGFIFYTPNPLSEKITLKDNSEIPGITKYRNMFNQIAIPTLAIIIAAIAISKIGSDNLQDLKSFGMRFLITIALFITTPYVLQYSIQANNLLIGQISTTQSTVSFINDYLDQTQTKIASGTSSEQYGIPSFDISLRAGIFKSLGKFIVQILLFALTFIFLLCAFMYIGFQAIIRFATLLFLGVLYPIVIPFALSQRTENIVQSFFKIWFTALIQQPAFVLGFAIATDIFASILSSKGPSVGMLFFFTGFLFFLGGVNMLVSRIFGDAWTAMGINMQSALAYRSVAIPVKSTMRDFSRGVVGGSIAGIAGREMRQRIEKSNSSETTRSNGTSRSSGNKSGGNVPNKSFYSSSPQNQSKSETSQSTIPQFSQSLARRGGLQVKMENHKQGVVSLSGDAYRFDDPKSGLTSIYPSRLEAIQDGVPEEKLERTSLNDSKYIDLSSFNSGNPNPHNFNAMRESKRQGLGIGHAYVNESSPPDKIKHFLEVSRPRNEAYGIKGVIVKRQGTDTSDHIIRMYSHKSYEKHKNI